MKDSQQEIKSTVTVNTSDLAAKAYEDKEQSKELEKLARKPGEMNVSFNYTILIIPLQFYFHFLVYYSVFNFFFKCIFYHLYLYGFIFPMVFF